MLSRIAPTKLLGASSRLYARSLSSTPSLGRKASPSQPVPRRPPPPPPSPPQRRTRPVEQPIPAGGIERAQRINQKSVMQSYKDLPYRTKLVFFAGVAIFASMGILVADKLEELFPARNNKGSERRSQQTVGSGNGDEPKMIDDQAATSSRPKLFSISVVDRESA